VKSLALKGLTALAIVGAAGLYITRPQTVDSDTFAALTPDPAHGARVFTASGCASCHMAEGSKTPLVLSGGQRLTSPFGTFVVPNISSDPEAGIGGWTLDQFASAVTKGTSPEGQHYFPAFPYAAYQKMTDQDVADLWAYMQTLPADQTPSQPHEVSFPFNIRTALGGWKMLFTPKDWVMPADTPQLERGRYLVEAQAHCGECHTPRNALGGLQRDAWLIGAPDPSGRGKVPDITPATLGWSAGDIAYYLESGFTPDYDSAGGHMAHVVENMAQLPASDREAIAAYLLALPN
jgi:mono/diheme cytochrome c family protein